MHLVSSLDVETAGSYNEQLARNSSTACIPCATGLYSPKPGANSSSTCVPCNAGSYSEKTGLNSSTLCTLCVAGKFSSELGANNQSTCIDCKAGLYSEQEGANSSSTCVVCVPGNYSETVGAWSRDFCLPCPSFTYSPAGSNNLTHCICNQGYTGPNGQECVACIAGTYKVANGSQACALCERGKYSTGIGQISQDTCIQCLENTFSGVGSSNLTNCICNVGFTGPDGINCTACVAGTYKDVNGSAVCSLCARGKYSSETAETSETTCTLCPQNSFTAKEGSIVVTNCTCNMGFTGPDGVECTACIPGTFKDVNGTANCTVCARGKYSEEFEDIGDTTNASRALAIAQALAYQQCLEKNLQEGTLEGCETLLRPPGCTACPNHTFSAEGSGNRTMCVCNQGYTGPDGIACDACIAGTYKDINGSQACTLCQRGKYSTGIAITRNDSCVPCPDSSFSALGSGNITDCLCNAGWEGKDGGPCSACAAGTFKSINGTWNCTETCVNKTVCYNVTWSMAISGVANSFLDQLVFVQYSSSAEIIGVKGVSTSGCTHKVNHPPNWRSSGNATCSDYVTNGWCSRNSIGPNWQSSYGIFADYAGTNGVDAGQACCECGGGQLKLSSSYKSINVTAPAYISEVRYKRMNCTNSTASCNQDQSLGCGISFYTNRGEIFAFEGSNYDSSLVCHNEVSWTASAGHMITSITYDFIQRNVTGIVQALLPAEPCGAKVNCTKNCIAVTNCTGESFIYLPISPSTIMHTYRRTFFFV
jgi:hypothetical protein